MCVISSTLSDKLQFSYHCKVCVVKKDPNPFSHVFAQMLSSAIIPSIYLRNDLSSKDSKFFDSVVKEFFVDLSAGHGQYKLASKSVARQPHIVPVHIKVVAIS
jgi:hypothetical protein